jgi:hypothetical protein
MNKLTEIFNYLKQLKQKIITYYKQRNVYTYLEATYFTELQIVLIDNNCICSDKYLISSFDLNTTDKHIKEFNPYETLINNAFKHGVLHTFDKSNQHFTDIATVNIKRILYKTPTVTIVKKEI